MLVIMLVSLIVFTVPVNLYMHGVCVAETTTLQDERKSSDTSRMLHNSLELLGTCFFSKKQT